MPDMPDPAQLIELAARVNRVNTDTPFGSQTYVPGPDGSTTLRTDIGPMGQALIGRAGALGLTDSQRLQIDPRLEQLAGGMLGRVGERFGMDLGGSLGLGGQGQGPNAAKPPGGTKPGSQPLPSPGGVQPAPGLPPGAAPGTPGNNPGMAQFPNTTPGGWQGVYDSVMPNTSGPRPGSGYNSMPWAGGPDPFAGSPGAASPGGESTGFMGELADRLGDGFGNIGRNIRGNFGDITGQNGGQGLGRFAMNYFIPGLGNMMMPRPVDPQSFTDANANMDATRGRIQGNFMDGLFPQQGQGPQPGATDWQPWFDSQPAMSQREMDETRARLGFANIFAQGRAGDIGQQLGREAEERTFEFQRMAGNRMR